MSREARHASLLEAAAELLIADRTDSEQATLTFEAIAEQAGVSPTLPYKYFHSVDEIANELYQRIVVAIDGWVADSARSLIVGTPRAADTHLIGATEHALAAGIAAARPGNRLGDKIGSVV